MKLRIQYFAGLREALGVGCEEVEPPAGITTVGALRDWLAGQGREALASARVPTPCATGGAPAPSDPFEHPYDHRRPHGGGRALKAGGPGGGGLARADLLLDSNA